MFPIPGAPLLHFLLETLGVMLAYGYYQRLRKGRPDPISDAARTKLLIAAALGAFVGSRLLGSLEDPTLFWAADWRYYLSSKTIVGGLLGGLFAVESTKRWLGIRHRSGDVYVYPLLLAMLLGRVGCFLMGVGELTYGLPTDSWLGMDLGDGILRHATALYEIVFLGFSWLFLHWLTRKWHLRSGRLFMLFLSSYLAYRFVIGFWQPRVLIGGLGAIQWACLLGLTWYVLDWRHGETSVASRKRR